MELPMLRTRLLLIVLGILNGAPPLNAQPAVDKVLAAKAGATLDLSEYRTAASAATTKIASGDASSLGQTGYLGVAVARDDKGRLIVEDVQLGSPAAKAGLKKGDVVTRVGDHAVEMPLAFREWLQSTPPGVAVKLGLVRAEGPVEVSATLTATSKPMLRPAIGKKGRSPLPPSHKGGCGPRDPHIQSPMLIPPS
jgi:S1-C subfamily serine protease